MQIDAKITRYDLHEVRISIDNGSVEVSAPFDIAECAIRDILIENANWIKEKIKSSISTKANVSKTNEPVWGNVELVSEMFSYKKVLLAGKILEVIGGDCVKTYFEEDKLVVSEKAFRDVSGRRKAIGAFLKSVARQCLRQEISQFGTNFALCPAAISVTNIKNSGWIRCKDMANRIITIDYRVIQLPYELRQYLITHLFAHFFQPGHDVKYFKVLSNYLPNFEVLQNKLERYAFLKEIG